MSVSNKASKARKAQPADEPETTRRRVELPPIDCEPDPEGLDGDKVTLLWLGDTESSEAWFVNQDSLENFITDCMRSRALRGEHASNPIHLTITQFIHRYISCWANFRVAKCFRNWLMTRKPSVARRTDINRMNPLALAAPGDVYVFYSYTLADSETHHVWNLRGITMDHEGNKKCADYADCTYARVFGEFNRGLPDPEAYDPTYTDPNVARNVVPDPVIEEEEESKSQSA